MRSRSKVGALALMAFAIAGIAWFTLELAPPNMGFEDTDSPSVSLRFLRANTVRSTHRAASPCSSWPSA